MGLTEQGLADPRTGQVPARLCDWLLAIEDVEDKIQKDHQPPPEQEPRRGR